MNSIKNNLEILQENIRKICKTTDTNPDDIITIGVSKTIEIEKIKESIDSGLWIFGENKVQEAEQKVEILRVYAREKNIKNFQYFLIGHLQKNKAKKAVKIFDMIQSVDSLELLREINKYAKKNDKIQDVLIQINASSETTKSGIEFENAEAFFDEVLKQENADFQNVKILGLMTIGPLTDDINIIDDCFKRTKKLFDSLKFNQNHKSSKIIDLKYLSMGMSSDYELAIKNGSNMIRVGQAIFGKRNYAESNFKKEATLTEEI